MDMEVVYGKMPDSNDPWAEECKERGMPLQPESAMLDRNDPALKAVETIIKEHVEARMVRLTMSTSTCTLLTCILAR